MKFTKNANAKEKDMKTLANLKKKVLKNEKAKKRYSRVLTKIRVAQEIYELRKKHHITQRELARRLHTSQQEIVRLEKDGYMPTTKTLERLAEIFHKELLIKFV